MKEKLMQAKKQAMIDKDNLSKSILSVLHGKAQSIAKEDGNREMTDADVVSASQALIKQNQKARPLIESNADAVAIAEAELKILNGFLRVQLSEAESIEVIDSIIVTFAPDQLVRKNQGTIMSHIKVKADVINMGFASKYVSSKLS